MNTPKSIALLGCALLTATLVYAQELSPDAKKQAEEALRQKMLELDQQSKASAAPKVSKPKATTTKVAPAPAPKPAVPARDGVLPVPQAPKVTSAPEPAKPALDPAVEAQARELLRMKLAQPEPTTPKPAVVPAKPAVVAAPAPAPKPAPKPAVVSAPIVVTAPAPAKPTLDPAVEAQARELLRAKIAETTAPAPAPAPKPAVAPTKEAAPAKTVAVAPAKETKPAKVEAKKPVAEAKKPAPAAPVVAKIPAPFAQSKVDRLNELTARYMADKITPHEYHQERAKIIAEP